MNIDCIKHLYNKKKISLDVEAGITLKIRDDVFRSGTVRIHLPAPINAEWLKEGRLVDSDPMFRMMSVEDFPQRSAYYNEILTKNTPFVISYGFYSEHEYVCPDIALIDGTAQKSFTKDEIARFSAAGHCGCESYTALTPDKVTIKDVAPEKGIKFKESYKEFLKVNGIDLDKCVGGGESNTDVTTEKSVKRGTLVRSIYDLVVDKYALCENETLNTVFVSMCRMCGVPARWQGGWALSDYIEDSSIETEAGVIKHDWAIVNLQPYGWVYVDCGFARRSDNIIIPGTNVLLKDFFFGNIDPCMVPTASAPAADLYPAKDYVRADEIYNYRGEAELVPGKMNVDDQAEGYGLKANEFDTEIYIKCDVTRNEESLNYTPY